MPIALGTMSLDVSDPAACTRLLHQACELGIRHFDTADLYDKGENERIVGAALRDRRSSVHLATKVGNQWRPDGSGWDWNPRPDYIMRAVENSLHRLQTDYIDLYQLHGGTLEDPIDDTIGAFERLVEQGKIRSYGISSIRPNVIREWVRRGNLSAVMLQYSLLDRRPEEAVLNLLAEEEIPVVVRGGVVKGLLVDKPPKAYLDHSAEAVAQAQAAVQAVSNTNRSAAQTALRFCLRPAAVDRVAIGTNDLAHLREAAETPATPPLTETEYEALQNAAPALVYTKHR